MNRTFRRARRAKLAVLADKWYSNEWRALQVRARLAGVTIPETAGKKYARENVLALYVKRTLINRWVQLIEAGLIKRVPPDWLHSRYYEYTDAWMSTPSLIPEILTRSDAPAWDYSWNAPL